MLTPVKLLLVDRLEPSGSPASRTAPRLPPSANSSSSCSVPGASRCVRAISAALRGRHRAGVPGIRRGRTLVDHPCRVERDLRVARRGARDRSQPVVRVGEPTIAMGATLGDPHRAARGRQRSRSRHAPAPPRSWRSRRRCARPAPRRPARRGTRGRDLTGRRRSRGSPPERTHSTRHPNRACVEPWKNTGCATCVVPFAAPGVRGEDHIVHVRTFVCKGFARILRRTRATPEGARRPPVYTAARDGDRCTIRSQRRGLWRSLVSALVWGTKGPGFESRQPD